MIFTVDKFSVTRGVRIKAPNFQLICVDTATKEDGTQEEYIFGTQSAKNICYKIVGNKLNKIYSFKKDVTFISAGCFYSGEKLFTYWNRKDCSFLKRRCIIVEEDKEEMLLKMTEVKLEMRNSVKDHQKLDMRNDLRDSKIVSKDMNGGFYWESSNNTMFYEKLNI